jgi:hypothetical protein
MTWAVVGPASSRSSSHRNGSPCDRASRAGWGPSGSDFGRNVTVPRPCPHPAHPIPIRPVRRRRGAGPRGALLRELYTSS